MKASSATLALIFAISMISEVAYAVKCQSLIHQVIRSHGGDPQAITTSEVNSKKVDASIEFALEVVKNAKGTITRVAKSGHPDMPIHILFNGDQPEVIQVTESAGSSETQYIAVIDKDSCKVSKIIESKTERSKDSRGSAIQRNYISSDLCHELPQLQRLAADVRRIENNPLYDGNQYRLRCKEQGGDWQAGCKCRSGKYIMPFSETCFSERAKESITPKDRLKSFLYAKDSTLNLSSQVHIQARNACDKFKDNLLPPPARAKAGSSGPTATER